MSPEPSDLYGSSGRSGVSGYILDRSDRLNGVEYDPEPAGRHRAPQGRTLRSRALTTTGVTAALVGTGLAVTATPAFADATSDAWAKVRQCESGGNYQTNTGNGYYGAYQFSATTWHSLGYSGLPSDNPPAVQDQAAQQLFARSGWQQWPVCGKNLIGIDPNGGGSVSADPGPTAAEQAAAQKAAAEQAAQAAAQQAAAQKAMQQLVVAANTPTPFSGTVLSTQYQDQFRLDTLKLQNSLRKKAFVLPVDGKYGPETAGVASLYSYLTRQSDGTPGTVGPEVWRSAVGA